MNTHRARAYSLERRTLPRNDARARSSRHSRTGEDSEESTQCSEWRRGRVRWRCHNSTRASTGDVNVASNYILRLQCEDTACRGIGAARSPEAPVPGESKERSAVHKRSRTHHVVKVADKGNKLETRRVQRVQSVAGRRREKELFSISHPKQNHVRPDTAQWPLKRTRLNRARLPVWSANSGTDIGTTNQL